MGGELWLVEQGDKNISKFLSYLKKNFLLLLSNNQCIKVGIKDAAICRRFRYSECISFLLNVFCSTITIDVIISAKVVFVQSSLKERGYKCKADKIGRVYESLKIEVIVK